MAYNGGAGGGAGAMNGTFSNGFLSVANHSVVIVGDGGHKRKLAATFWSSRWFMVLFRVWRITLHCWWRWRWRRRSRAYFGRLMAVVVVVLFWCLMGVGGAPGSGIAGQGNAGGDGNGGLLITVLAEVVEQV